MKKIKTSLSKTVAVLTGLLLCLIALQGYAVETGPDRCGDIIEISGDTKHYTNPAGYKVKNATDNDMFKEEIYGSDFTAKVKNLPPAEYSIEIFMAESYWSSSGNRLFHIYVQDSLIVKNLDIFAKVGKDAEYVVNHKVDLLSDENELSIRFKASVDNGKFNAIHISRNDSIIACGMAHEFVAGIEPTGTGNPFIQHMYTADPSAHVFDGKMYVYPSHDKNNPNWFDMRDYHVFSSSDLHEWEDHGVVLDVDDVPWASEYMWAPDCAHKEGWYYFYFPAKDHQGEFKIGVATSQSPAGPFTPEPEPITGSFSVDPAVFIDDDGQAYMYFGGDGHGGQLTPWVAKLADNMKEFSEAPKKLTGINYWFEACWVNKIDSIYYLSYSTGSYHPSYPSSSAIAYATSTDPMGPFTYQGVVNGTVSGWTNHHSIVEFKEQWYLFYHTSDLSGGVTHKRSICADYLHFNDDGSIRQVKQTKQGIGSYNGLTRIEAENYSETHGATKQESSDSGLDVSLKTDDTLVFYNVDFKEKQVNAVDLRIASDSDGGILEIRNESDEMLGEIQIANTGGLDTWQTLSGFLKLVDGKQKITLKYRGTNQGRVNLNWLKFRNDPSAVKTIGNSIPQQYELYQNYPNPFNPTTTIIYALPETAHVSIIVFDMMGREIQTLVNTRKPAGFYQVPWNATNAQGQRVTSGMYFYRIKVEGKTINTEHARKMILLK